MTEGGHLIDSKKPITSAYILLKENISIKQRYSSTIAMA